jgi:hypothetical protein
MLQSVFCGLWAASSGHLIMWDYELESVLFYHTLSLYIQALEFSSLHESAGGGAGLISA